MDPQIAASLIGAGGVIYASTIAYLLKRISDMRDKAASSAYAHRKALEEVTAKGERAQKEFEFQQQVKNPYIRLNDWQPIADEIEMLCRDTEIDRVLMLVAVNGVDDPKHATVVWEYRQDKKTFAYVDVPLDADYVRRLIHIREQPLLHFKTNEASNTLIGNFYAREGVTECVWEMIGKRASNTTDQVAYKYMSFATHEEGGIASDTLRRCTNIVNRLRSVIHTAGFHPI